MHGGGLLGEGVGVTPNAITRANVLATEHDLRHRSGISAARLASLTAAALGRPNHRIHRMGVDAWRLATLRQAISRRRRMTTTRSVS